MHSFTIDGPYNVNIDIMPRHNGTGTLTADHHKNERNKVYDCSETTFWNLVSLDASYLISRDIFLINPVHHNCKQFSYVP
jgi:hypothetical protein